MIFLFRFLRDKNWIGWYCKLHFLKWIHILWNLSPIRWISHETKWVCRRWSIRWYSTLPRVSEDGWESIHTWNLEDFSPNSMLQYIYMSLKCKYWQVWSRVRNSFFFKIYKWLDRENIKNNPVENIMYKMKLEIRSESLNYQDIDS